MRQPKKILKKYKQLFRMPLSEIRFLIVSRRPDGKLSMAQQIKVQDEEGRDRFIFIKNAFVFNEDEVFEKFRRGIQKLEIGNKINKNQLKIT